MAYSKKTHISMPTENDKDQFKSMNVHQDENSKRSLSLNPGETTSQGLAKIRNEL